MYADSQVTASIFEANKFDKIEFQVCYTFPSDIADQYSQYYSDIYESVYPRKPKTIPSFKAFLSLLPEESKIRVTTTDLQKNPIHYLDPAHRLIEERLSLTWHRFLPEIQFVSKGAMAFGSKEMWESLKTRSKGIYRVIEKGIVYEGEIEMETSIKDYYQDQIQNKRRVNEEDRPSMKDWYKYTKSTNQYVFDRIKKYELPTVEA